MPTVDLVEGVEHIPTPVTDYLANTAVLPFGADGNPVVSDPSLSVTLHAPWGRGGDDYPYPAYDVRQLGVDWNGWPAPPSTEDGPVTLMTFHHLIPTPAGRVLELTLSRPVTILGFELAPECWRQDGVTISRFTMQYYAADTVVGRLVLSWDSEWDRGGLVAIQSPNRPFDRVTVDNQDQGTCGPSIARIRYGPVNAGPAKLLVGCNSPVRGEAVECTARIEPAHSFRVIRRLASSKVPKNTVAEQLNLDVPKDSVHRWRGIAAADTRVIFEVEMQVDGKPKTLAEETQYTVVARTANGWSTQPQLSTPLQWDYELDPGGQVKPWPTKGVLGGSSPNHHRTANHLATASTTEVPDGPNKGLRFLTDPLPGPGWIAYIYPGLDPQLPVLKSSDPGYQLWHRWRDDQDGSPAGTCTAAILPHLRNEVLRHEGVTLNLADSHYGTAVDAYLTLNFQGVVESHVRRLSESAFRQELYDWITKKWHVSGDYKKLQDTYDRVDRAQILAGLGCDLDHTY